MYLTDVLDERVMQQLTSTLKSLLLLLLPPQMTLVTCQITGLRGDVPDGRAG
jgi:hypothetical protein